MSAVLYPRVLEQTVRNDLALYPVVAVMGARQVGKSTLCRLIADELGFTSCTLDDRDIREIAQASPESLLDELGAAAFIDEAQRAPGLFLAIKAVVDRERRSGAYLLSGSNQPSVAGAISESLLGRAAYRTLRPLTLTEQRFGEGHGGWSFAFSDDLSVVLSELEARARSSGILDWREACRSGGFPRALAVPREFRGRMLNDYVEIFASRDVREVLGVESPERFERFLRVIAAWTGQEMNALAISNDLGVAANTIRRWLDALKRSYLLELIPPFSRNASQRVIRAPKMFMVDSALAMAASRETEPTGFHLETLVANDLLVWRDAGPDRALYHWRLSSGQEVDFVIQEAQGIMPVEIKATRQIRSNDARHLRTFCDRHSSATRGLLLSCDPDIRPLDSRIIAAPFWAMI